MEKLNYKGFGSFGKFCNFGILAFQSDLVKPVLASNLNHIIDQSVQNPSIILTRIIIKDNKFQLILSKKKTKSIYKGENMTTRYDTNDK